MINVNSHQTLATVRVEIALKMRQNLCTLATHKIISCQQLSYGSTLHIDKSTYVVSIVIVLLVTRLICLCLLVIHCVFQAPNQPCDTVSLKLVKNIKFQPKGQRNTLLQLLATKLSTNMKISQTIYLLKRTLLTYFYHLDEKLFQHPCFFLLWSNIRPLLH